MKKPKRRKPKFDQFSYHEVMDRAYVAMDHFNDYVAEHEATKANPQLDRACIAVLDAMNKVYQIAGNLRFKDSVMVPPK